MLSRRVRRDDRGQTMLEAIAALGLIVVIGMLTLLIYRLLDTQTRASATAAADGGVRVAMDRVTAQIREARAPGACAAPAGAAMSSCRRVVEQPFSLVSATPFSSSGVCFYSSAIGATALSVPDQECVSFRNNSLGYTNIVRTIIPGSGTYTTPAWSGSGTTTLVVERVDPAATTVTYTLVDGTTVTAPTAAELPRIVLVNFSVTTLRDGPRRQVISSTLNFSAAPRGARYANDQSYKELGQ